ncbi:MAG TPA: hypothetical protein VMG14_05110, partial [Thermoplasmata archaeon]|nr:hypothetical protein [Thermoplasmata archaeon]
TTATVVFALANGSYSYTIGTVTGFVATPASGTFSVMGMAVDTPISFAAIPVTTYTVTFTESGLPSGTSWSVTLNGVTKTAAAGSSIVFTGVANGTVSYSIGAVSGYSASPSTGSVTVQGANKAVSVSFASTSTSTSSSGLSPLDWAIIGIVIALIVIGVVVALARRGRRGPSSTTPSSGTSSTGPTGAADGSSSTPGTEPPTGGSS